MCRRNFFVREHAEKFGATYWIEQGEEMFKSFANYLIASADLDDAHEAARGRVRPTMPGRYL